jgi:hypothetical protein
LTQNILGNAPEKNPKGKLVKIDSLLRAHEEYYAEITTVLVAF